MRIGTTIGGFILSGLQLLGEQALRLVRRKPRDSLPEVDVTVSSPPAPLTYKDVAHQRAQMDASIAASKVAAKPDTLPKK